MSVSSISEREKEDRFKEDGEEISRMMKNRRILIVDDEPYNILGM